jgi:hypothetical protein
MNRIVQPPGITGHANIIGADHSPALVAVAGERASMRFLDDPSKARRLS